MIHGLHSVDMLNQIAVLLMTYHIIDSITTTQHFSIYPLCFKFPVIKELGEAAFDFVFEGSDLLAKVTEGLDPETCKKVGHTATTNNHGIKQNIVVVQESLSS